MVVAYINFNLHQHHHHTFSSLKNARTEDMNGFQQEGFGAMDMTVTYLGMVGMVGIGLRMLRVSCPPVLGEALKA